MVAVMCLQTLTLLPTSLVQDISITKQPQPEKQLQAIPIQAVGIEFTLMVLVVGGSGLNLVTSSTRYNLGATVFVSDGEIKRLAPLGEVIQIEV